MTRKYVSVIGNFSDNGPSISPCNSYTLRCLKEAKIVENCEISGSKLSFIVCEGGYRNPFAFQKVTKSAYAQITQFGMNARIGNVSFEQPAPGEMVFEKPFSEATAQAIDEEANKLIKGAMDRTLALINNHKASIQPNISTIVFQKRKPKYQIPR